MRYCISYYEYKIGLKVVQLFFLYIDREKLFSLNWAKLIKIYYNDSFVIFNKIISINTYILAHLNVNQCYELIIYYKSLSLFLIIK